jgi:hypothetical protein
MVAHLLRSLDQVPQFRLRVVRRDATTAMPEQDLPILERNAGRRQSPTERVLQIVYADILKSPRRRFAVLARTAP